MFGSNKREHAVPFPLASSLVIFWSRVLKVLVARENPLLLDEKEKKRFGV